MVNCWFTSNLHLNQAVFPFHSVRRLLRGSAKGPWPCVTAWSPHVTRSSEEGNGLTANRTDLLKSQLQPGSRVRWTISSDDIPRGELGEVLLDVNAYSDIKVKFSAGEFRMRYSEMLLRNGQCFLF